MLRLSVQSLDYSVSVNEATTKSALHGVAVFSDPPLIDDLRFPGPVRLVISSEPVSEPFQHGSIYWDMDAYGDAFAMAWLFAPAQLVDRIADKRSSLSYLDVDLRAELVNGGNWLNPKNPLAVSGFSCTFSSGPVA